VFSRILVANRGEIALRIIRACQELGIQTVAVYSEADKDALYLRLADDTVCIGAGPSAQSYLDVSRIVSAAEISDVEAIHPGYGFLAENADFAEVCRSCHIQFIGPTPEAMRMLGDKASARACAIKAGVPVVPGSEGLLADEHEALAVAREIGYPVMLKATAGGGGRGMRMAHNDASLVNGFRAAQAEAEAAFKSGGLYIEKAILGARHVEFQIMADHHGHVIHLGERDCSLQRRRQKLVEESPSPVLTPAVRQAMGEAALRLARAAGYQNLGTAEFLLAADNTTFYFIEVNCRIQVEHPVTELVTGLDLVHHQLRIAAGDPLRLTQEDVRQRGSAIECRINAEDPANDFAPSAGKVGLWVPPGGPGVRVDSHCYSGMRVPPFYDSMLAKLIVHRDSRRDAIACMRRALEEFVVEGVKTTIPLFLELFAHARFANGEYDTNFVENYLRGT
jgi:acetyl-CoA carboxylase biotin carboxylase subunit